MIGQEKVSGGKPRKFTLEQKSQLELSLIDICEELYTLKPQKVVSICDKYEISYEIQTEGIYVLPSMHTPAETLEKALRVAYWKLYKINPNKAVAICETYGVTYGCPTETPTEKPIEKPIELPAENPADPPTQAEGGELELQSNDEEGGNMNEDGKALKDVFLETADTYENALERYPESLRANVGKDYIGYDNRRVFIEYQKLQKMGVKFPYLTYNPIILPAVMRLGGIGIAEMCCLMEIITIYEQTKQSPCITSNRYLSARYNISLSQVAKAIKKLIEKGLVRRLNSPKGTKKSEYVPEARYIQYLVYQFINENYSKQNKP